MVLDSHSGDTHVCDDIVAFYGQTSDIAMKENVSLLRSSRQGYANPWYRV